MYPHRLHFPDTHYPLKQFFKRLEKTFPLGPQSSCLASQVFAIVDHSLFLDILVTWILGPPHSLDVSPPSQAFSFQCLLLDPLPPGLKVFESSERVSYEISSNFITLNIIDILIIQKLVPPAQRLLLATGSYIQPPTSHFHLDS